MNAKVKSFLTLLSGLPEKLLNIVVSFVDGIARQVATLKGAVLIVVGMAFAFDLVTGGKLKIFEFAITTGKDVLTVLFDAVKGKWFELVMIAIILVIWKKK